MGGLMVGGLGLSPWGLGPASPGTEDMGLGHRQNSRVGLNPWGLGPGSVDEIHMDFGLGPKFI